MSTTTPSPTTPSPRQGPSMDDVLCLLQAACLNHPKLCETLLHNYFQGVSVPADLPPEELARFTDYVFWHVKQAGISDPAAWLAFHRDQQEAAMAPAAPIDWEAPIETGGDTPIKRDTVDRDPFSSEPPPPPVAATIALAPSEIAKTKIAIEGDVHVSTPSAWLPCWAFQSERFRVYWRKAMARRML
jgi:hypothetical protein